ncbi:hypothetical protein GMORB2_4907 [Geosmithia morbida]|uniref:SigF-like NTF2-like domain-containing protein n=1 Tax=Geosmithia morbida TaxID=1094350 RepID=A0A9P5CXK8_9HYPO|nr:uncharacterized protein GMORB2_4907 [Geosmithia morbida]KAF4119388.1 hypothetical protein GMORB2_4907 [Geosmithia morbida]
MPAPVQLVTVLQLVRRSTVEHAATLSSPSSFATEALTNGSDSVRYYIASQDDRYHLNDCIRFVIPWLLPLLWSAWQLVATGMCVLGSLLFLPLYLVLNKGTEAKGKSAVL